MSWLRVMSMRPRPRQKWGSSRNTRHSTSLIRSSRCQHQPQTAMSDTLIASITHWIQEALSTLYYEGDYCLMYSSHISDFGFGLRANLNITELKSKTPVLAKKSDPVLKIKLSNSARRWYLFHEQLQNESGQCWEYAEKYVDAADSNKSRARNFEQVGDRIHHWGDRPTVMQTTLYTNCRSREMNKTLTLLLISIPV